MKRLVVSLAMGTLLFVAGIAGAGAADALVGSWTLNAAKSKYSPGPAPKAMTRTYVEDGDKTTLTFSVTTADGTMIAGKSEFQYDGKNYPYSGSADYDGISIKKVNGSTAKSTLSKAGKPVGTSVRTLSGHGKTLTLSVKYTDTKGVAHNDVSVFDRQ